MSTEDNDNVSVAASVLLVDLQQRANKLLAQLKAYQACLQRHQRQKDVEIRTFKRGVESEAKALNAASTAQNRLDEGLIHDNLEAAELETRRLHSLRSSNLPFYEAVWSVARQSSAIVALGKHVYCHDKPTRTKADKVKLKTAFATVGSKMEKKDAVVDIMAKDGLEWIKVSTITEKRLLFEMAKEGWETYDDRVDSEHSGSEAESGPGKDKDDVSNQLELIKLAKVLYTAARETRIRFKHPRVKFILPKIHQGVYDDVDAVIADIRAIGVTVICGEDHDRSHYNIGDPSSSLQHLTLDDNIPAPTSHDLTHLLPSPSIFSPLPTPTLNIDCTILLALISDISHIPQSALPPHPPNSSATYHTAITRQITTETTSPLLPTELYPLITGKALVCTNHAAQRMREIVQTMGTNTERARADIFLAENAFGQTSPDGLRTALEAHTCHAVPVDLALPLRVVEVEVDALTGSSTSTQGANMSRSDEQVLAKIAQKMPLSVINESVFLYGWRADIVTVTSNRVVANGLVRNINEVLDEEERAGSADADAEDFRGPAIYVCETARSLIGKEKQGC